MDYNDPRIQTLLRESFKEHFEEHAMPFLVQLRDRQLAQHLALEALIATHPEPQAVVKMLSQEAGGRNDPLEDYIEMATRAAARREAK